MSLENAIAAFKASIKAVPSKQLPPFPKVITLDHYRLGVGKVQGPQDPHPLRVLTCDLIPECGACIGGRDKETWEVCRCVEPKRRAEEVERSGLPPIARKRTFAAIDPDYIKNSAEVLAHVEAWRRGEGPQGILFHGVTGSAKTHLAHALLLEEALNSGRRINYVVWPELALKFKSVYQENRNPHEYLRRFERADVFALDELGGDVLSDWTAQWLMSIINHAEDVGSRFILTTNLDQAQLSRWAKDRLASRLAYLCRWVTIDAADFRRL